jgi:hypothetical protein
MKFSSAIIACALSGALAACSGGAAPIVPKELAEYSGTASTVYSRIARGANSCWFGPRGFLDRTYIWHGKAEPEAKGGAAEILVHERAEENQRGLKAYLVTIEPKGESAHVAAKNLKMPELYARRMTADVYHWAGGGTGCGDAEHGWSPVAPAPAKAAAHSKKPAAQPKKP